MMNKPDKSSTIQKIDRKWVKECKRTFSEYPGIPRTGVLGEEETWLELAHFYRDDLKWLLSLEHHVFWSHMIYSEKANEFLVSFLKGSFPNCMKRNFLVREDVSSVYREIEHLVLLAFLRLSSEKESSNCFVRNFREIIYNNYLFTVPVILDICLIYGASNHRLVQKMINNIVTAAPDFLDDFQEIIPHFLYVLKTVKEKLKNFEGASTIGEDLNLISGEIEDIILYLCDTVATVQIFFELYPNVCQLFNKAEIISEIVHFYSNILPDIFHCWLKCYQPDHKNSFVSNLIENVRIDLLKIVKNILGFVISELQEVPEKEDYAVNEFLTLVMKFLKEPCFLSDYDLLYSLKLDVEHAVKDCKNVDWVKVNHILEGVASGLSGCEEHVGKNFAFEEVDVTSVKFNSLVTEVKDILPHLEENFIKQCLNYYNNNTEKVVAAVLENLLPPELLSEENKNCKTEGMLEFKGKHKNKHKNMNEMLDDREEISKMKEKYAQLSFVTDEAYDDEYDDTYDETSGVSLREGEEAGRRPFVVPRVLRTGDEEDVEGEGEESEEDEAEVEDTSGRDNFVENPAVIRERRMKQLRPEQRRRDVEGTGRGHGQSKQVLKNREFKEFHKSQIANHNRKKQAGRKLARGMIPS